MADCAGSQPSEAWASSCGSLLERPSGISKFRVVCELARAWIFRSPLGISRDRSREPHGCDGFPIQRRATRGASASRCCLSCIWYRCSRCGLPRVLRRRLRLPCAAGHMGSITAPWAIWRPVPPAGENPAFGRRSRSVARTRGRRRLRRGWMPSVRLLVLLSIALFTRGGWVLRGYAFLLFARHHARIRNAVHLTPALSPTKHNHGTLRHDRSHTLERKC